MDELQKKCDEDRRKLTEFLKEIGQEYPPCGYCIGDGWKPHVEKALRAMAAVGIPWKLDQVKQKFCQLRIYFSIITPRQETDPDEDFSGSVIAPEDRYWEEGHPLFSKYTEMCNIVGDAEVACDAACEDCGAYATPGPASGTKLCDPCKERMKAEYKKEYGEEWED